MLKSYGVRSTNRYVTNRGCEVSNADVVVEVHMIYSCLKLHGQMCPPEMLAFHATLEKFFHKNFADEIRRLSMDSSPEPRAVDAVPTSARLPPTAAMPSPNYAALYVRSPLTGAAVHLLHHSRTQPLNVGPIHVGMMASTSTSPLSPRSQENGVPVAEAPWMKQTPLQRHLAYLARFGFNGVSSGPGDNGGNDSFSEESPRNSVVTVGNNPVPTFSGAASVTASTLGSIGSIKGRFSKLGSLNFGRRDL